jgi:hypothetical protein
MRIFGGFLGVERVLHLAPTMCWIAGFHCYREIWGAGERWKSVFWKGIAASAYNVGQGKKW